MFVAAPKKNRLSIGPGGEEGLAGQRIFAAGGQHLEVPCSGGKDGAPQGQEPPH